MINRITSFFSVLFLLHFSYSFGQSGSKIDREWQIANSHQITKKFDTLSTAYSDNIEMAGKRVAAIITYKVDGNRILKIDREVFFPQLRTLLKSTDPSWYVYRAYLKETYTDDIAPQIVSDNIIFVPGAVKEISINGMLSFQHESSKEGLQLRRVLYPSTSERLFMEKWELKNTGNSPKKVLIGNNLNSKVDYGAKGTYTRTITSDAKPEYSLGVNQTISFSIRISAQMNEEGLPSTLSENVYQQRKAFIDQMNNSLVLETPDETLNTLFNFSKIRGSESIFESKLGLIHSPGGGRYYCGFWANDQAEYIGPFFPYLGYNVANDAALNMYRLYLKEISPDFKNIRYSFEMEGDAPVNPLDRGDAAMIAYGTAQFLLARGDKDIANELYPLVDWCLEYCRRNLNEEGVVSSESDEMEGRIETGDANLSTSSLYYGALLLTADLAKDLGKPKIAFETYKKQAADLAVNIEDYFGDEVEGIHTYKYFKEHKHLRHWICLPLMVGINTRSEGTLTAIFDKLWTENGVHVEKNAENPKISKIFWDRGTLYALRGAFLAGATEVTLKKLQEYSTKRLLGDHVPYVVEAFPEGNMAHLSAESGLYCRVFTEGLFGIVPSGLKSFTCAPQLPQEWNEMKLKNIKAFGEDFNLSVERERGGNITTTLLNIQTGKSQKVNSKIGERIVFNLGD